MSGYVYRGRDVGGDAPSWGGISGAAMDFSCVESNKEPQTRSLREFEQVSMLLLALRCVSSSSPSCWFTFPVSFLDHSKKSQQLAGEPELSLIRSSNGFWELCQVHYGFGAAVGWLKDGAAEAETLLSN
ncbi:hypothetical protein D4764_07G0011310 [Takifugu flavidus]|uniref:Uncharacterized protein n=1 Tax=Takifugu flavidus TaxID=433684 RepID=A0A5C6MT56_9TELE|nr:hypothetical protein D4764_07G0011310 [Takifugu flavidus]